MAHDIFISYAREDLNRVRPIVQALMKRGWSIWWDQQILAGKKFTSAISNELQTAKAVIVVWSEHSVDSVWVQSEAEEAMAREVLVPVRIDAVTPPHPFGRIHGVDHLAEGEPSGASLALLVRSLEALAGRPRPRPAAPTVVRRPVVHAASSRAPLSESIPAPQNSDRVQAPPEPPSTAGTLPTSDPSPADSSAAVEQAGKTTPRAWRRTLIASGVGVTLLCLGWLLRSSMEREPVSGGHVLTARPGAFQVVTDPGSGSRLPLGWEIVDGALGVDGWAVQVREPSSGIVFQLVPPDRFLMGSPPDEPERRDNETQHPVRLTRPFYLGVTEVTGAEFQRNAGRSGGTDYPVGIATWSEARRFCRGIGCDLPTEAQWEYAARAGTTTRWWWGDSPGDGRGKANVFDDNAGEHLKYKAEFSFRDAYSGVAPAGQFEANPFGLKDMIGNVWEWCLDDYDGDYGPEPREDPRVEVDGRMHVARGGSAFSPLSQTRVAHRLNSDGSLIEMKGTTEQWPQTGFRACLNLP